MNSQSETNRQYLVLYFQVHQPRRLRTVNFFDLPNTPEYFNDSQNADIVRRVARQCYVPTNNLLLDLIEKYPGIKISFSISGIVLEQLEAYAPEALETFRKLARTGSVEFLSETYYHSLASLVHSEEFETQVLQHAAKIQELFGMRPVVFRNTELIYNDEIGKRVAMMGFRGIFIEGHERALGQRSPHTIYCHPEEEHLKILARNYRLSDDIGFRFMQDGTALSAKQYMQWLRAMPTQERFINLAMDYETFGEHQQQSTGIFDFLRQWLGAMSDESKIRMVFPSEAIALADETPALSIASAVSWADLERDLSAWLGNDMQKDAFNSLMKLELAVKKHSDPQLLSSWRYLQTSDHFYYMCVKTDTDGSVHAYFSPFPSSYEAFINYMNVITHLTFCTQQETCNPASAALDLSAAEAERQNDKTSTPVWVMNLESVPPANVR